MSRRTFVGLSASGVALLASGVPLASLKASGRAGAVGPRLPLHLFVKDPTRLASLRRGVAVMKARKPSDPGSWFFQAAIHGVLPERVAAAAQLDPGVGLVDKRLYWNRCPHYPHTHSSPADFLVWHRAYLYYFERILRAAAEDESLSLPYWDYSGDPALAFIPPAFKDPEPDPVTGEPSNPLYHAKREKAFGDGSLALTAKAVSLDAMKKPAFFGLNQLAGMWSVGPKGELDKAPHGLVHKGIGEDMNHFPRAGFDPLFWVHHCNVDRLWAQWDAEAGKEWGDAPPRTWFEERPWWFHDVDGKPVNPPRMHFIQRKWLPVKYDFETTSGVALSETLPGPAPVLDLGSVLAARNTSTFLGSQRVTEISGAAGALRLSAEGATSVRLQGTARAEAAMRGTVLKSRRDPRPARTERFVFLELAGIPADGPPEVAFDVHLNAPPGTTPERSSASFVGTLSLFGGGHEEHGAGSPELFDISERAQQGELGNTAVVTLVPFALLGGGSRALPPIVEMRVDQVRIFVAEAQRR